MKNREATTQAASDSWSELFEDVSGCGDCEPDLEQFVTRALKLADIERRAERGKYRVTFEMTYTAAAYVEADSEEEARALAQELHANGGSFLDGLMGDSELEETELIAVHEVPRDSVAFRVVDAWTPEDV